VLWYGNPKERDSLKDIIVDGMINMGRNEIGRWFVEWIDVVQDKNNGVLR
jgi:hypothetical protein